MSVSQISYLVSDFVPSKCTPSSWDKIIYFDLRLNVEKLKWHTGIKHGFLTDWVANGKEEDVYFAIEHVMATPKHCMQ